MELEKINITIDDREYQAHPGEMIIEVADRNKVYIPRFCYHKHLSIAANCRMCLVEVENAPKPLVACATPISNGMVVKTKSPLAKTVQRDTMEFLLINHPLDCPICDQGGECELQDLALGYGATTSQYEEDKRVVADPDLGPLISTDMTRCIHCTRCVRFGEEVAQVREMGATGRGEDMKITPYIVKTIDSELSGNIIDLCPVGALNSKPFRMQARAWEMEQHEAIAPHDSVGSSVYLHTLRDKVMRVVPRDNENDSQVWISDRDRFSYAGLYSDDRMKYPEIYVGNQWRRITWHEAYQQLEKILKSLVENNEQNDLGILVGATSTTEDSYALSHFFRKLSFENIDYRLKYREFNQAHNKLLVDNCLTDFSMKDLGKLKTIFSFGSYLRKDYPMISLALQTAVNNGASLYTMHNRLFDYTYPTKQIAISDDGMLLELHQLLRILEKKVGARSQLHFKSKSKIEGSTDKEAMRTLESLANDLIKNKNDGLVLCSSFMSHHPQFIQIAAVLHEIARLCSVRFAWLPAQINEIGLSQAGCLPSKKSSMHFLDMLKNPRKHYFLFNTEPEFDSAYPSLVSDAFKQARSVVSFSPYASEQHRKYATLLLPLAGYAETSGSYINCFGKCLSFSAATSPLEESRSGWHLFNKLAELFSINQPWYSTTDIRSDLINNMAEISDTPLPKDITIHETDNKNISLISQWGVYQSDALVRRSLPLQETSDGKNDMHIYVAQDVAEKYSISHGARVELTIANGKNESTALVSKDIPSGCVSIFLGTRLASPIQFDDNHVSLRVLP